jgi:hypothetical protein
MRACQEAAAWLPAVVEELPAEAVAAELPHAPGAAAEVVPRALAAVAAAQRALVEEAGVAVAPRSPAAAASQPLVAAAEPAGPLPGPRALADVRAPGSLKEAVAARRVGRAAAVPRASAVPGRLVLSSLPADVAALERPWAACALGRVAAPH